LLAIFHGFFELTTSLTRRHIRIHSAVLEYFHQLAPEGGYILLDLIHIVLGDSLGFGLSLLHGYITSDQIPHYLLVLEVPITSLLRLSLQEIQEGIVKE